MEITQKSIKTYRLTKSEVELYVAEKLMDDSNEVSESVYYQNAVVSYDGETMVVEISDKVATHDQ